MRAVPPDYDEDPERFRLARRTLGRYGVSGDIHDLVARHVVKQDALPVLDVGKGVAPDLALRAAEAMAVPLTVTKRGALAFARRAD